jgi:uncharacterized protein with von Willebrand factor type A (vWA) domain
MSRWLHPETEDEWWAYQSNWAVVSVIGVMMLGALIVALR